MDHDSECGMRCEAPGCKEDCCIASIGCNSIHKCFAHLNVEFTPVRRATVSVSIKQPGKRAKFIKVEMELSATVEWDNMLNVQRAAENLVQQAFYAR